MVRRRGRPRRSYAWLRMRKYGLKYTHHVVPIRFKLLIKPMSASISDELRFYDEVEGQTILECLAKGVPDAEIQHYLAFSKRVFETYSRVWETTAEKEIDILVDEFVTRGLDATVLSQLRTRMYVKAAWRRGIIPPPAWNYDNIVGVIWLPEPKGTEGASYDRLYGTIYLGEPEGIHGGYYDNR